MDPGIEISRVWSDEDMVELRVRVSDGTSSFTNLAYVAHAVLDSVVVELSRFREAVHGGLLDIRFGEFGPEYANGAFHGRFHFHHPGRLLVSCEQESEFRDVGTKKVASRAMLFIWSEPALLDRFISELRALVGGDEEPARLERV